MKENRDYIQDLAAMRRMMERSSKFLSLSGLAGVLAGIYALAGALVAYRVFHFQPKAIVYSNSTSLNNPSGLPQIILLALTILVFSISTAIFLSRKKARKQGEKIWNATAKRLVINMAVPLVTGGILILVLLFKGLIAFAAP